MCDIGLTVWILHRETDLFLDFISGKGIPALPHHKRYWRAVREACYEEQHGPGNGYRAGYGNG